ncbi:glycoside hydrolase family 1 protein [Ascodesmis nigricans]|uniref:beta-glucosidase n=1 Tax=Ascodesmis nigricans TaxID=341454 RepID=A0A4S2N2R1_9PEZI|nr:glycoside hydrolase family 1 protein [Ascodesmis nigricans]
MTADSKLSLPKDFVWGYATASYQIEGAANEDGRGPSIWDTFCKIPGKIADGSSGDVACDAYHRTQEDVALLKSYGAKAYRFSISWSRVIPLGGRNDPVNPAGIKFYQDYVDELLANGITPFVTLFHWDLPQALHERYLGFLNKNEFASDFEHYARVCFEALPKVKNWITFNEPWCSAVLGYNVGAFAPGRTSDRSKSKEGDSTTEHLIVGHSILLGHARAVKAYRDDFKSQTGGQIGITLNGDWTEPWDPSDPLDIAACERKLEFAISWFADPIYFGDYPASMRTQYGSRLPTFTPEESALIKGSNDFYGMNHYTANYIKHRDTPPADDDVAGNLDMSFENKLGESIGPETQSVWLRPHPEGFRKLLIWLSERYGKPTIYVTENGTSVKDEHLRTGEERLRDELRCEYFRTYIEAMTKARCESGVDVRGYFAWSLMDNFEWAEGYVTRFGVTYTDYENGQKRTPKQSAYVVREMFDKLIEKE